MDFSISTHTLRGERDNNIRRKNPPDKISTHTLRGERDHPKDLKNRLKLISTHTLRGERDSVYRRFYIADMKFQLTRSVGSVTKKFKKIV